MDNIEKLRNQYFYTKRIAEERFEEWNLSFNQWLAFAQKCNAIDEMLMRRGGKKIGRHNTFLPWQEGNLSMANKFGRRAPFTGDMDASSTTLTVSQWVSALEADKARLHKYD